MAKMLMAAVVAGSATAALIVYLQRRKGLSGRKNLAGKKANHTSNNGIGEGKRLGTAAMG